MRGHIVRSVRATKGWIKKQTTDALRLLNALRALAKHVYISRLGKGYHFVHLMHNDKFIELYITETIRRSIHSHLFVIHDVGAGQFPIPELPQVVVVPKDWGQGWISLLRFIAMPSHTVAHGLFSPHTIAFAEDYNGDFAWVIWGGDLYDCKRSPFHETICKIAAATQWIITVAPADDVVFRVEFGFTKPSQNTSYYLEGIKSCKPIVSRQPLLVQVNNSADLSAIPVFDALALLDDRSIHVTTVLSYGAAEADREAIKNHGTSCFSERFQPLTQFLSPSEYISWLQNVSALIMNQPRQQGLGNIAIALCQGTRVFLRSDVSTWKYLKEDLGFHIEDTIELLTNPATLLQPFDEKHVDWNRQIASKLISYDTVWENWHNVFNRLLASKKTQNL